MRKMVMLVSAVVAALGLAVAGPASERELSRHPIGARTRPDGIHLRGLRGE